MQSETKRIDRQLQRVQGALRSPPRDPQHPRAGTEAAAAEGTGDQLNKVLVEEVMTRVLQTQRIIDGHHRRLRWTYAVYMVLAVLMFLAGLALLFMPLFDKGNPERIDLWLSAVGGAEIVALLIFSPFQRIQGLMGDMTQVILLMEGYLHQVALRLLQCRIADPDSVGAAAGYIYITTKETARLIQDYFENAPGTVTSGLLSRRKRVGGSTADPTVEALRRRLDRLTKEPISAVADILATGSDAVGTTGRRGRTTVRRTTGRLGGSLPG